MATEAHYGPVDPAALERLRESFNTSNMLEAVDKVDHIRYRIDSLRDELLKLHAMAHDLFNGAGFAGTAPESPIRELAEEVSMAISEWPEDLEAVCETVEQLVSLTPDPDEGIDNE
jgi:hypothetical protein